jgi:hypothetical protein
MDPDRFEEFFDAIKAALKKGGIFTGQFFGVRDEWNHPGNNMKFVTREEAEKLLTGMKVLGLLEEEEKDEKPVIGDIKHWHLFHIIAEKE